MAFSTRFAAEVEERLGIDGLQTRRMFGALGLYAGAGIFGLVMDETLYLRLDETAAEALRAAGGQSLRPLARKPELESRRYVSVPLEVFEDDDQLLPLVRQAVAGAAA